jgi:transposase, IS30 family
LPACAEREVPMNNRPTGNHKHLDLSERIIIERGLADGASFRAIALETGKDPSTISKEVRKHATVVERSKAKSFAPVPCAHNRDDLHPRTNKCNLMHVCGDNVCNLQCGKHCKKYHCSDVCSEYLPKQCSKLCKPPYVCNGCSKRANCLMAQRIYSSKYAYDSYRNELISSREGINQTPESIQKMNDILTPLIKKGQSMGHIYASHAEELGCSRRTAYTYIDSGVFDVMNMDLRRKVKYKKRKKATTCSLVNRAFRQNRTYKDFLQLLSEGYIGSIVELDTVEGKKGTKPCFMTILFPNCNLMLIFLLQEQTQAEIKRVFDYLTDVLGIELFHKLFEVILTDNGSEFQNPDELEYTEIGEKRTSIYYCDPYRSNQKGALEKNHEYIRYVRPKGTSFEDMDDEKTILLMNHINSEKRDSLNGHSPFELSQFLLDNKLHECLKLNRIEPDNVNLTPGLLK